MGDTTIPVYIASDGTATALSYSLAKSVPANAIFTDTTYSTFGGADGTNPGSIGLVVAPNATDNEKFLKGNGTWDTVSVAVTTTDSVIQGSTDALSSGGAYTNLVRRLSSSVATGSASQGVYIDENGQVQTCDAVSSSYSASGTVPINGTALASALASSVGNGIITFTQGNSSKGTITVNQSTDTTIALDAGGGSTVTFVDWSS